MKNFRFFLILLLVATFSLAAMAQVPTSNLLLWLKTDAGVDTLNGKVSVWHDQSGNGNDAIQTTESRQPLLLAGALNGKPVVYFDGIDDRLGLTGSTTMSQISLFIVFKIDSGLVGNPTSNPLPYYPITFGTFDVTGKGYGLSMRNFFSENSPHIIDPFVGAESYVKAVAPNIAAYDQWKVLSVVTNQTMWNTTVRSNGVDAVITPQGTANTPLSVPLGVPEGYTGLGGADNVPHGQFIFKGDIAEVIVYDTVLTDSEKLAVENYLADKYNISIATGIEDPQEKIIPEQFTLSQNYPDPFNPSTKIKYSVSQSSQVIIKVYDILGNEIETLVNEEKPVGNYELTWNAANLPSGVYIYQIKAGSFIDTKKMILLK